MNVRFSLLAALATCSLASSSRAQTPASVPGTAASEPTTPTGTRGASAATSGAATASSGAPVDNPGATRAASGSATSATGSATSATGSATAPTSLALTDALDVARRGSFSAGSAQARIQAAQARLQAAGAFPGTTLTLARAFGSQNTAGFDEDVILGQVIEFGKRGSRVRGARADVAAAQFDRAGAGTDLEFALRSAYFEALRADIERDLADESLKTALLFQTAAQTQLTAGDVPRANVVRSSIEVSRARATLEAAQSDRRVRYAVIRSLLGVPDESPVQLGDRLTFSPQTFDLGALQELANKQRADLQSARATLESKQAGVAAARALSRPDAFIEARRAGITSYPGLGNGTSLRVGVVIPIFDFGRNRAGTGEARAGVVEQTATLAQTTRAAQLDVATAFERFVSAQRAVQSFDSGRLAQSRELLDMAQIGYEHGANSYLELIDAQTVYRAEQADYARALASWNTALADLQRAVGGKLP